MNWRDEGGSVRCGLLTRMTSLSPAAEPKKERKVRINPYLLGLLPGSGGPATRSEAMDVLLFLLCWLEDLVEGC